MREDPLSNNERDFIFASAQDGIRIDGRGLLVERDIQIFPVPGGNGVVEVCIGETRCLAATHAEVVAPLPERPSEGFFSFLVDYSPMASPSYELQSNVQKRQADVSRVVERAVRQGRALDVEGLCILAGRKVWSVRVDVRVLDDAGNVCDCASIATLASLLSFRRNDVTVTGDDVIVHSVEDRDPVPLIVHHVPLSTSFSLLNATTCVLDPLLSEEQVALGTLIITANKFGEICGVHKAGGVPIDQRLLLRCTEIALERARRITSLLTTSLGLVATAH